MPEPTEDELILKTVSDAMRLRLAGALEPLVHNGRLDAKPNDVLDAVMPVIDEVRWRQMHVSRGRCRWCNVIVDGALLHGKPMRPHLMRCRFYVGPVEHRQVGGYQALTHWSTECSCGRQYDAERGGCPNAEEDWRGAPSEELL